jgi:hypothetical protein
MERKEQGCMYHAFKKRGKEIFLTPNPLCSHLQAIIDNRGELW